MFTATQISDRTFRPKLKKYEPPYAKARYAHWKRDGHLCRLEVDIRADHWSANGNSWSAWTRRPTDVSWDVHDCWRGLNQVLAGIQNNKTCGIGKWVLLGEMFYPDMPASYIKSGLANGDTNLEVEFFAILQCPGYMLAELYDLPLEEAASIAETSNIPFVPFHVLENRPTGDPKELFEYTKQATRDIEGFVFKDGNLKNWYRWKDTNTIDLIVTGFTLGEGKYTGQVGALTVSTTEGYEVASISGMTDAEREEMTQMALNKTLQDRVCEVSYQLVGSRGRLRHPQFVRWREDKDPKDCTLSQDADLEKIWLGQ